MIKVSCVLALISLGFSACATNGDGQRVCKEREVYIALFGGRGERAKIFVDDTLLVEKGNLAPDEFTNRSETFDFKTSKNKVIITVERPRYGTRSSFRLNVKRTQELNVYFGFTKNVLIEDARKSPLTM